MVIFPVSTQFLICSEKMVWAIHVQFYVCIDPLDGCVLLHFFGVHGAGDTHCNAPFKNGFHTPASQTLQHRIIKLCEKTDDAGGMCFLWQWWCGVHRMSTGGIESIVGDLHQEDSFYQMARAVNAKIGMFAVNDITHHGMPP